MRKSALNLGIICIGMTSISLLSSCGNNNKGRAVSDKTGWNYNDRRLGGFEVANYQGQVTGPGLVFVEGGRFTMGQTNDDVSYMRNNIPRTVSVSSFYMDETEVANVHYREYVYWTERTYGSDYAEVIREVLPDTTVWRKALSYNEPAVNYYFRHAAYDFYPVVGVSWNQANDYCKWRTDRVNEMMLIKKGILKKNPNQVNEDQFDVDAYVADQYIGLEGSKKRRDLDPTGADRRNSTWSDGTLLPAYRLPTEAEWEYAALALISENPTPGNSRRRGEEAHVNRKDYPWGDFRTTRSTTGKSGSNGLYYANYKRGRGDAAGVTGGTNDAAVRTAPVNSYYPNALGLYNMAGNVNEWVLDTYRPTSHQDVDDINPFRGNVFTARPTDEDNLILDKDSLGRLPYRMIDSTDLADRWDRDYNRADVRDAEDGSPESNFSYQYGATSRINNNTKVIKGGSWEDVAYWLTPGTRRPQQANHTSATVGFRCVMDRLGSMGGNGDPGGNYFPANKKRK